MSFSELVTVVSGVKDGSGVSASKTTICLGSGASIKAGVGSWPDICKKICRDLGIENKAGESPIDAVKTHFQSTVNEPTALRALVLDRYLGVQLPTAGYNYLAYLVTEGYVDTIITTNWDCLVEQALYGMMSPDKVRVLVRGDMPDDRIAEYLEHPRTPVTVVKIHGDLIAGVFYIVPNETSKFSPSLKAALTKKVSGTTIFVGQGLADNDLMSLVLDRKNHKPLYYAKVEGSPATESVNRIREMGGRILEGKLSSVTAASVQIDVGDFDNFFTQLTLALQLKELQNPTRLAVLREAEQSILEKEKSGRRYFNYHDIGTLVDRFYLRLKQNTPSLVFFVNDPSAPGGMEVMRRLVQRLKNDGIATGDIRVEGEGNSRVFHREAHDIETTSAVADIRTIFVVDSITFSGNTLQLAKKKIQEAYPAATVHAAVLVISQHLLAKQNKPGAATLVDFHESVTDRPEVFFPWGVTQTTSDFDRTFKGGDGDRTDDRVVQVRKRPWGTIEILADNERTSVRLLTIEAAHALSFQRHLCRDELFVALDDNIGLEVCTDDETGPPSNKFDPRVKSLILEKGDYILIPRGTWHRTKASMDRVRLLELGFGLYDQSSDIQRIDDRYGRLGAGGHL